MSIVTVENVSHSFGGRQILENVSFRLLSGEHVGLVGANGEGKSTFLNILTGKLVPEEGRVAWCRRITRGYLDQHTVLEKGKSIRQVLQDAFSHLFELEAEMLQKYEEMGDCSEECMNTGGRTGTWITGYRSGKGCYHVEWRAALQGAVMQAAAGKSDDSDSG